MTNRSEHWRVVHANVEFTGTILLELLVRNDQVNIDGEFLVPLAQDVLSDIVFYETDRTHGSTTVMAAILERAETTGEVSGIEVWEP